MITRNYDFGQEKTYFLPNIPKGYVQWFYYHFDFFLKAFSFILIVEHDFESLLLQNMRHKICTIKFVWNLWVLWNSSDVGSKRQGMAKIS